MARRYFFIATTASGHVYETRIDANTDHEAYVEAKLEVAKWLAEEGETPGRLTRFDLIFTAP